MLKLRYLENYLLLLMAFISGICIYLLYRPYKTIDNNDQVVAKVIGHFNTVKRKKDFFQSWKDTNLGDGLSSNDEIYTHEKSFATIEFNNGNKVEISENTLIKIKNNIAKNSVELNKGNIVAELNKNQKNIEINIHGKKYNFSSENAKIQIEQNSNENKFIILEGAASVKSDKINAQLKNNETIKENITTGSIEKIISSAKLIFPKRKSFFYFDDKKLIRFQWDKLQNNENIILIASDREFKNIIVENATNNNFYDHEFITPQTIFWKISAPNSSDSPIFEFQLAKTPVIELRSNQTVFINHKTPEKALLVWDHFTNIKDIKYVLNITDPENKVSEIETIKPNYTLPLTILGEYKVKVKLFHKEVFPQVSYGPMVSLYFKNIDKFELENLGPNELEKVWYKNVKTSSRINWQSSLKTDLFNITITDPEGVILTHQTTNNFFEIEHNKSGTYKWEVVGFIGDTKSNSIKGNINFKRPIRVYQSPEKGAIIELQRPDQNVNFKWDSKDKEQTEYEIEISKDDKFLNPIIKKTITENSFSTAIDQLGIYYWRVKILKADKIEYSEPASIELRPIPPLIAPDQIPELKIKLKEEVKSSFIKRIFHFLIESVHANEKFKKAEWSIPHNPKVKTYVVKIYNDPFGKNLVKTIESNDSHFTWSDSKPGIYFWSMAYIDFFNRQTDFSKLSKMEIIDELIIKENRPKLVDIPKPISPIQKKINLVNTPSKIESAPLEKNNSTNLNKINYQFFFTPKIYTVSREDTNKIEINGVNIESLEVLKPIEFDFLNYDETELAFKINRGKVFNTLIFNDFESLIKFKKDMAIYKHGPQLFFSKNSKYEVINRKVQSQIQLNAIFAYSGLYQLDKLFFEAAAGYGTGLFLSFEGNYRLSERYTAGIFFQNLELNNQNNQYLGLKFGYNFFK